MADMTPDEARAALESMTPMNVAEQLAAGHRALATLAAMRVEHDHGVVDWETVEGRYEKFHRVRLVSEWRDA